MKKVKKKLFNPVFSYRTEKVIEILGIIVMDLIVFGVIKVLSLFF